MLTPNPFQRAVHQDPAAYLWKKVNPFLPFDRKLAQMELATLLMEHGDDWFVVDAREFSADTKYAATINGLQSLGLLDRTSGHHQPIAFKVSPRGHELLKEDV